MESRRYQPISFFLVSFGHIPRRDPLAAFRTKQGSVKLRKIDGTLDNTVIIHLYKIALTDLLIKSDKAFTICARDLQYMASPDLPAIRIFVYYHQVSPTHRISR